MHERPEEANPCLNRSWVSRLTRLIVHAAVVFVPLQIAAAIVYAVVPAWRRYMTWAALALIIVGPAAAWAAKLSGEAFQQRLLRNHLISGPSPANQPARVLTPPSRRT